MPRYCLDIPDDLYQEIKRIATQEDRSLAKVLLRRIAAQNSAQAPKPQRDGPSWEQLKQAMKQSVCADSFITRVKECWDKASAL